MHNKYLSIVSKSSYLLTYLHRDAAIFGCDTANMVNLARFIRHQIKGTEQINLFMTPRPQDVVRQRVKRDTGDLKAVGFLA